MPVAGVKRQVECQPKRLPSSREYSYCCHLRSESPKATSKPTHTHTRARKKNNCGARESEGKRQWELTSKSDHYDENRSCGSLGFRRRSSKLSQERGNKDEVNGPGWPCNSASAQLISKLIPITTCRHTVSRKEKRKENKPHSRAMTPGLAKIERGKEQNKCGKLHYHIDVVD